MKQVAILGGLLAVSLVGAYLTWTAPEEETPAGDVLVMQISADELTSVTWTDADKTVKLTRPTDAKGPYFLVHTVEHKKIVEPPKAPEPGDTDAAKAPEPAPEPKVEDVETTFAGGADAEKIWKAFAPFHALRELVGAKPEDLAAYGLDKPGIQLDLEIGGKATRVEIGGEAFGTRDRYARVDGRIYLLDDESLRPLQFATTRLVERRVYPYEEKDIARIAVSDGANSRSFLQKNADDKAHAYWADAGKPDDRDVEASTWIGKLLRMKVRSYDLKADAAAMKPIFDFTVEGKDGASWKVEVLSADVGGQTEYFAKPEWTRTPVELTRSLSEEAIADLGNLFDGIAAPAEPAAPEGGAPAEGAPPADALAPGGPAVQPVPIAPPPAP